MFKTLKTLYHGQAKKTHPHSRICILSFDRSVLVQRAYKTESKQSGNSLMPDGQLQTLTPE